MTRSRGTWTGVAIGAAVVVALLLLSIRRAPETYPWGDTAATSIYALRAANGELAVGSYSRFGWNHPGPLLYELLAPLYALTGYREISLKWMMLLMNLGALTALLVVMRRRAPMLAVTVALALLPLLYREQRLLFWAWNPIAPLLPLALAVALSAGVASGSVWLLPVLFAVTSFLVQSHVGFAPVAVVMLMTTVGLLAWRIRGTRRAPSTRDLRRAVVFSVLVLAAAWAVPIIHDLRNSPGNLTSIASFFVSTPPEPRGWSTILAVFANQIVGPFAPSWELTTIEASGVAAWPTLAFAAGQIVLLIVALVRASRRGATFEAAFAVVCLSVSLVGVIAIRSIVGPVSDYLITWIAVIGALNVAAIAAEAIQAVRLSAGWPHGSFRWALAAYLVGIAVMGGIRLTNKHAYDARSVVIRTLAEKLDAYCRTNGIERPMLRFSLPGWEGAAGVLLQSYKNGRPIAVPDDLLYLVGNPFRSDGREPAEFYLMHEGESAVPDGVVRHEWVTTYGSFRLIRLFRAPLPVQGATAPPPSSCP